MKLNEDLIEGSVDMVKSPLSTLLQFVFHQIIHNQPNVEEVMDRIFAYLDSQPVLGHTNLQNIARIRLMLDLQENI
jgi:hypothetical protein